MFSYDPNSKYIHSNIPVVNTPTPLNKIYTVEIRVAGASPFIVINKTGRWAHSIGIGW